MMPHAEIIAVGSELLTPFRIDTNSLFLTRALNDRGIQVHLKSVVGDDRASLEPVLRMAVKRSDIVILTGGLGPTEDDITRTVVAQVLGRRLVLHDDIVKTLLQRFSRLGMEMPESNTRQALIPVGGIPLENRVGTAPGLWIEEGRTKLILLPGPPRELQPIFKHSVEPRLAAAYRGKPLMRRLIKLTGITESEADQRIASIYQSFPRIRTTILASPGQIEVHLSCSPDENRDAERELDQLQNRIEEALSDEVFSTEEKSLEEVVGIFLGMRGSTLAVAESCTGGLIAKRLTDVSGSSSYFLGGLVCYSNRSKIELLGVEPSVLSDEGAVSAAIARQMAAGVRQRFGSTLGLSVTGIAGPGGGSEEKPVGLIFLGWDDGMQTQSHRIQLPGDRSSIRERATLAALNLVRRSIIG